MSRESSMNNGSANCRSTLASSSRAGRGPSSRRARTIAATASSVSTGATWASASRMRSEDSAPARYQSLNVATDRVASPVASRRRPSAPTSPPEFGANLRATSASR